MSMSRLTVVLVGLLVSASAMAQEADPEPGLEEIPFESEEPTPPDSAPQSAPDAQADEAPAVDERPVDRRAEIAANVRAPESREGLARAELVTFQTLLGIGLGSEVCVLFECSEVRGWVGALMLGAGAGFGLSFWLTDDGVTHGQAAAVNSGVIWGTLIGVFLAGGIEPDDEKAFVGTLIGMQLIGLGVGSVFAAVVRPPASDVSLMDSFTLWTVALTGMGFGAAEFDGDPPVVFWSLLGATAAGLAVGSQLWRWTPMSRGRALIIDSGGIVGFLLGMGTAVLIAGDDVEAKALFGAAIPGTLLGLGLTYFLTRDFDLPDTDLALGFGPTPDGGALAFVQGTF